MVSKLVFTLTVYLIGQVLLYGNDSQHYQVSENSLVDFISYGVLFNILF